MKLAVIGGRGVVGNEVIKVALQYNIPFSSILVVTSDDDAEHCVIRVLDNKYKLISLSDALFMRPDFVVFATNDIISSIWAPKFVDNGCIVVDNSSAWRMDNNYKLIVPEVNGYLLSNKDRLIANPNCCVIQLVAAICLLHKHYKIKRLVISTYQSVSGGGQGMLNKLIEERNINSVDINNSNYSDLNNRLDLNVIPQIGSVLENFSTVEEVKIVQETKKILADDSIGISCTSVRVPTMIGHGLSVNIEFNTQFEIEEVYNTLKNTEGIVLMVDKDKYYTPCYVQGHDKVFVSRVRRDDSIDNGINLWIVADNIRKGAALNAMQIIKWMINIM